MATKKRAARRTLKERAQAIIAAVQRYDIDTRQAVRLALSNLTFIKSGGGCSQAKELPAEIAEYERALCELVARVEAGERVTKSHVPEEYDKAARTVIELADTSALPDFFREAIYGLLNMLAADLGVLLWQETTEGGGETGDFSIDVLARTFAHHRFHELKIERKKDLADLISAVLKHPDMPVDLYNSMREGIASLDYDASAPEFIRHALAYEPTEKA